MPTHLKTQLTHATSKQILINNSITSHNHTTSMATKNNKSILQYLHKAREGRKVVTTSVKAVNYQGNS